MKPLLCLVLLLPALTSCRVLKPVEDRSINHLLDPAVPERKLTGSSPGVAVARPSLPSYLDRLQLVSRTATGELQMNPYHVWAEPLDAAISRVTAANLGRLTQSLNIQPVENFITLDYQWLLELRVSQFELDARGDVVLACTWKLQPVAGRVTAPQSFTTRVTPAVPATAKGPQSGRIQAMNEALVQLARTIARALPEGKEGTPLPAQRSGG
jgi:uncharacterized protein